MATFVVAHGAWSSGWAWKKMRPLLRAAGHEIFTPSYTGLGERIHLSSPDITLETHIQDVANVLFYEDLTDVVLIGHSYGGMVATGVADRVSERIRKVIYLDAFVPRDGQAVRDLTPASRVSQMAAETPDNWLVEPNPSPPDTDQPIWRGSRSDDIRSRAGLSRSPSACRALSTGCRGPTSTASRPRQRTISGSSPSARNQNPAGSTRRSTPATIPTSPRRARCSTSCCCSPPPEWPHPLTPCPLRWRGGTGW